MSCPSHPRVSAQAVDCSQVAEWSRAVGWDIEYQQVGRGSFNALFSVASCRQLRLTDQFCNRPLEIYGSPPRDTVALVLPSGTGPLGTYEGTTLRPNDAIVLLPGEGRCLRSPACFRACTVSIPRAMLEEAIWHDAHCRIAAVLPESQCFAFSPKQIQELAATIRSLIGGELGPPGRTATAELEDRLIHELARGICQKSRDMERRARHGGRAEHVKRARDYIEAHLKQAILLNELAAYVGVSIRTLELAFRGVLGIAPIEYIRTRRLNRVRQRLIKKSRGIGTLTNVALEHGLFHLGRFSRDYKALFGELPRETLGRSRS